MSLTIFLSHAWRDKRNAAFKLVENGLRADGYNVWVDKREMDLGDDLGAGIAEGIGRCDLVLALWSSNYLASAVCRSEVDQSLALGKPVVQLRLDDEDPTADPRFENRKYLDFRSDPEFGLLQLQQFLLRLRQAGHAVLRGSEDIGRRMRALNDALAEVEDANYRRSIGASGNAASRVYVGAMLEAGRRMLATTTSMPPEERRRVEGFLDRLRAISDAHPDPADDGLKKRLLRAAIDEADPGGQSSLLQSFGRALDAAAASPGDPGAAPVGARPGAADPRAEGLDMLDPLRNHIARVRVRPDAPDALRQRLDQVLGSPDHPQRAQCEQALNAAIDAIPAILEQMTSAAQQAGVAHLVAPLAQQVAGYFLEEHDLVADRAGTLGLLDDAYLAHAFLLQVNVAYQQGMGRPLLPVDPAPTVRVLREILGPQVTGQLDAWVVQGVNEAVNRSQMEQLGSWGGRTGGPGSWGGTWEDEMARMGAEMGISFD